MKTADVSFGKVTVLSGNPSRMRKLNNCLDEKAKNGLVLRQDVTKIYSNAPGGYTLADAAANGDKVQLYVSGDDINKVKRRDQGWDSIEALLSQISNYCNLSKTSIGDAIESIMKG